MKILVVPCNGRTNINLVRIPYFPIYHTRYLCIVEKATNCNDIISLQRHANDRKKTSHMVAFIFLIQFKKYSLPIQNYFFILLLN